MMSPYSRYDVQELWTKCNGRMTSSAVGSRILRAASAKSTNCAELHAEDVARMRALLLEVSSELVVTGADALVAAMDPGPMIDILCSRFAPSSFCTYDKQQLMQRTVLLLPPPDALRLLLLRPLSSNCPTSPPTDDVQRCEATSCDRDTNEETWSRIQATRGGTESVSSPQQRASAVRLEGQALRASSILEDLIAWGLDSWIIDNVTPDQFLCGSMSYILRVLGFPVSMISVSSVESYQEKQLQRVRAHSNCRVMASRRRNRYPRTESIQRRQGGLVDGWGEKSGPEASQKEHYCTCVHLGSFCLARIGSERSTVPRTIFRKTRKTETAKPNRPCRRLARVMLYVETRGTKVRLSTCTVPVSALMNPVLPPRRHCSRNCFEERQSLDLTFDVGIPRQREALIGCILNYCVYVGCVVLPLLLATEDLDATSMQSRAWCDLRRMTPDVAASMLPCLGTAEQIVPELRSSRAGLLTPEAIPTADSRLPILEYSASCIPTGAHYCYYDAAKSCYDDPHRRALLALQSKPLGGATSECSTSASSSDSGSSDAGSSDGFRNSVPRRDGRSSLGNRGPERCSGASATADQRCTGEVSPPVRAIVRIEKNLLARGAKSIVLICRGRMVVKITARRCRDAKVSTEAALEPSLMGACSAEPDSSAQPCSTNSSGINFACVATAYQAVQNSSVRSALESLSAPGTGGLQSPSLLKCQVVAGSSESICVKMEWLNSAGYPADPEEFFRAADAILCALDVLHNHNVVHRDVRWSNVRCSRVRRLLPLESSVPRRPDPTVKFALVDFESAQWSGARGAELLPYAVFWSRHGLKVPRYFTVHDVFEAASMLLGMRYIVGSQLAPRVEAILLPELLDLLCVLQAIESSPGNRGANRPARCPTEIGIGSIEPDVEDTHRTDNGTPTIAIDDEHGVQSQLTLRLSEIARESIHRIRNALRIVAQDETNGKPRIATSDAD